ncbi:MAG: hypothetical protein A2X52_19760 [Candidatus Rokubacteria bacterium GWC2_70_16]|nr:MAG: hypothetical protein A2X52_19760 [Candidatus Rokubacteria bacterium GWC2_70_16]
MGAVWRFPLEPPAVPADLILKLQKCRDLTRVPPAIREAAEAAAAEASRLAAPEAVCWRGPVTAVDGTGEVVLDGTHRFHSQALARLLAPAAEAVVVVLTLGEALERRVAALFAEHLPLESVLLDTAGWAAIELLVRGVRRRLLEQERPAGRSVTHRLAPGYRDWPVEEQAALLGVFGGAPLPVRVTESAWLVPVKSISALFGVVRAA